MLTCVIDPGNILVLGGIKIRGGKAHGDGFILDHQTVEVSKLVHAELALYSYGKKCHVSSDGTIDVVIKDDEHNMKLVQINNSCEQNCITEKLGLQHTLEMRGKLH